MTHVCEICGKGWVFVTPRGKQTSGAKRYHWWCRSHFLIWMFNLYPYKCTKACDQRQQKRNGIVLSDEERYTWTQIEAEMSARGRATRPRCPRCRKPMRPSGITVALPARWRAARSRARRSTR